MREWRWEGNSCIFYGSCDDALAELHKKKDGWRVVVRLWLPHVRRDLLAQFEVSTPEEQLRLYCEHWVESQKVCLIVQQNAIDGGRGTA